MDVDGTLTDGKINISERGELFKSFNVKDGYGIYKLLPNNNIIPVIITGRTSLIVEKRAVELNIKELYQNVNDKKKLVQDIAMKYHLTVNQEGIIEGCAYIGDDIIDYSAMLMCECRGCPADAVDSIKKISNFICNNNGGEGAVREYIE